MNNTHKEHIKVTLYKNSALNAQEKIKNMLNEYATGKSTWTTRSLADKIEEVLSNDCGKDVYFNRNHVTVLMRALNINKQLTDSEKVKLNASAEYNKQRIVNNQKSAQRIYEQQGGTKDLFVNKESKKFKIIDFKNKYGMNDTQIKNLFAAYGVSMKAQVRYTWKNLYNELQENGITDNDLRNMYDIQQLTIPQIQKELSKVINKPVSEKLARNLSKKLGFMRK